MADHESGATNPASSSKGWTSGSSGSMPSSRSSSSGRSWPSTYTTKWCSSPAVVRSMKRARGSSRSWRGGRGRSRRADRGRPVGGPRVGGDEPGHGGGGVDVGLGREHAQLEVLVVGALVALDVHHEVVLLTGGGEVDEASQGLEPVVARGP